MERAGTRSDGLEQGRNSADGCGEDRASVVNRRQTFQRTVRFVIWLTWATNDNANILSYGFPVHHLSNEPHPFVVHLSETSTCRLISQLLL